MGVKFVTSRISVRGGEGGFWFPGSWHYKTLPQATEFKHVFFCGEEGASSLVVQPGKKKSLWRMNRRRPSLKALLNVSTNMCTSEKGITDQCCEVLNRCSGVQVQVYRSDHLYRGKVVTCWPCPNVSCVASWVLPLPSSCLWTVLTSSHVGWCKTVYSAASDLSDLSDISDSVKWLSYDHVKCPLELYLPPCLKYGGEVSCSSCSLSSSGSSTPPRPTSSSSTSPSLPSSDRGPSWPQGPIRSTEQGWRMADGWI